VLYLITVSYQSDKIASEADAGLRALEIICRKAMIDEQWMERTIRSFSWIGYRLSQSFDAAPPIDDGGIHISRVGARVPVIVNVSSPVETVDSVLADLNRYAVGSAYVYNAEEQNVASVLTSFDHTETVQWRSDQITCFAVCQIGQAETEADYLAGVLKGAVAGRAHPMSGRREKPDEVITFVDSVFGSAGNELSRFAKAAEFQAIAEIAKRGNAATWGGDEAGISIEVPFDQQTSLIRLDPRFRHRRVGNGLSFAVHLPLKLDRQKCAELAALLNREEACGNPGVPQFGAWCLHTALDRLTLAFTGFVPNSLYRPGIAQDVFYSAINRARWANQFFNPGAPEIDAWAVMRSHLPQNGSSLLNRIRRFCRKLQRPQSSQSQ
jgi:hypothetical protein